MCKNWDMVSHASRAVGVRLEKVCGKAAKGSESQSAGLHLRTGGEDEDHQEKCVLVGERFLFSQCFNDILYKETRYLWLSFWCFFF